MDDFMSGSAHFYNTKLLLHSTDKLYLLERLENDKSVSFGQILLVDLKCQLKNSENLKVYKKFEAFRTFCLDIGKCLWRTKWGSICFDLHTKTHSTSSRSRSNGDDCVPKFDFWDIFKNKTTILGGKSSILSSISSAAQNSSKNWFQKFKAAGEFQQFEAPIQLPQNLRLAESSAVVGEYG